MNMLKMMDLVKEHGLKVESQYIASGWLKYVGKDSEDTDWGNAQFTADNLDMYDGCEEQEATHYFVVVEGKKENTREFAKQCNYTEWLEDAPGGYGGESVFIFEKNRR